MPRKVAEVGSGHGKASAICLPALAALLRLVKNLRGVIYAAKPEESVEAVRWVQKRFQYRSIGYTPSSEEKFRQAGVAGLLRKKPFRLIQPSSEPVVCLIEVCRRAAGEADLAEVLLLASLHVAPVLLLGRESAERAAEFLLYALEALPQSDAETKRHLRILDYAALDAHEDSSRRGAEALARAGQYLIAGKLAMARRVVSLALRQQGQFAEQDCNQRFWRLRESRGEGALPCVLYLHPLRAVRSALEDRNQAAMLRDLISRSAAAIEPCLSLTPAFALGMS